MYLLAILTKYSPRVNAFCPAYSEYMENHDYLLIMIFHINTSFLPSFCLLFFFFDFSFVPKSDFSFVSG